MTVVPFEIGDDRTGYETDSTQDYTSYNGQNYRRAGNHDEQQLRAIFGDAVINDPYEGLIVPAAIYEQFMGQQAKDSVWDKLALAMGAAAFGVPLAAGIAGGVGAAAGGGAEALGTGLDAAWGVNPQGLGGESFLGSMDLMGGVGTPLGDLAAASAPGAVGGANSLSDFFTQLQQQGVTGPGGNLDKLFTGLDAAGGGGGGFLDSLSNLFSPGGGGSGGTDWLRILGSLGATGLGVLGANKQQDAMQDVANQYLGLGAPYRDKLLQSYQPGFDLRQADPLYGGALAQSADEAARAVSASQGNPFGNPGAMAEIQNTVLNRTALPYAANYRGQLGQFGGLGLNTSSQASLAGASGADDLYRNLAGGLGDLTTPRNSLEDLLRQFGMGGGGGIFGNNFTLNTRGTA